jgi:hypothetical protein
MTSLLLKDQAALAGMNFAAVVDARGDAKALGLETVKIVPINAIP